MTTLFTLYYYKEIQLVLFLFKTLNAVFLFLFCGCAALRIVNVAYYIYMH